MGRILLFFGNLSRFATVAKEPENDGVKIFMFQLTFFNLLKMTKRFKNFQKLSKNQKNVLKIFFKNELHITYLFIFILELTTTFYQRIFKNVTFSAFHDFLINYEGNFFFRNVLLTTKVRNQFYMIYHNISIYP